MSTKERRDKFNGDAFCPQKKTWYGNKEEVTFIWLIRSQLDDDRDVILKHLHEINNYVLTFDDPSICIQYMKSIKYERVLLIVSGKIIIQLYEEIRSCDAVDSIYIFCLHNDKYDHLQKRPKIAGIFTHQSYLFNALQNGLEAIEKQVLAFSRLDQPQHVFTKDLSRQSASFLWFMLLVEVLEAMPTATKEERTVMLDLSSAYYRNNPSMLAHIDEFRNTYTGDKALSWYTRASFVYRLVNKALRVEDVELLYQFRFFIIDLCKQLKERWCYTKSMRLREKSSTVYRGGKLTIAEVNALEPGHLITTNGFLSTTYDIDVARLFAADRMTHDCNYYAVIFHITIPENLASLVFADVDHKDTGFSDEKEVIFSIGARFRVVRVHVDKEKPYLYHIDLTATDDGCEDINTYRVSLERDLNETKAIFLFGRLLIEMDDQQKAKNYFELLLETTPDNNYLDIATIYSYLGRITRENGFLDEALSHHFAALQIRQQYLTSYHADLAASHNSLGLIYMHKRDSRLALCHFHRALDIETKLHGTDSDTNISKILGHIGLVHIKDGNAKEALTYVHQALNIEQRLLPAQHAYIGFRFENLGSCYMCQGDYPRALYYYQQALSIMERTLPIHHRYHPITLNGIIKSLDYLGEHERAIEFAIRKLNIDQTLYKGNTMAWLSELYLKINNSCTAYQYYQDALIFYEKNCSNNLPVISKLKQKLQKLELSFILIACNNK